MGLHTPEIFYHTCLLVLKERFKNEPDKMAEYSRIVTGESLSNLLPISIQEKVNNGEALTNEEKTQLEKAFAEKKALDGDGDSAERVRLQLSALFVGNEDLLHDFDKLQAVMSASKPPQAVAQESSKDD
jgi:hypothetical protein